jgi:hypothetical protein
MSSVPFKTTIALSVLVAVVSLGYTSAETEILNPVPVQSWSANTGFSIVETKVLTPELVDQDCTSRDHMANEVWCNGVQPYGTGCQGPGGVIKANSIKVLSSPTIAPLSGWGGRYDKGSGSFKCPWFVSTFSRAYVKFDVKHVVTSGTVEAIEFASLSWKTKRIEGNQASACIKYLHEATGLWDRGKTPTILLFSNLDTFAVKAGYFGVVKQVQKWFDHPEQNWGFMIEPSQNFNEQYSSSKCLESLEDLRLTVKYRVKPTQWPG